MPYSNFLTNAVKYESEVNTAGAGKLDTRSELRRGAFDTLQT